VLKSGTKIGESEPEERSVSASPNSSVNTPASTVSPVREIVYWGCWQPSHFCRESEGDRAIVLIAYWVTGAMTPKQSASELSRQ
jgi:hypothetical protein